MARQMQVLGAGLDDNGVFLTVEFLDRSTHPVQKVPMTASQALGVMRSIAAALQKREDARTTENGAA